MKEDNNKEQGNKYCIFPVIAFVLFVFAVLFYSGIITARSYVSVEGGTPVKTPSVFIKEKIASHGFVSTAGGAMLDFLANGTLPGIEALKN